MMTDRTPEAALRHPLGVCVSYPPPGSSGAGDADDGQRAFAGQVGAVMRATEQAWPRTLEFIRQNTK